MLLALVLAYIQSSYQGTVRAELKAWVSYGNLCGYFLQLSFDETRRLIVTLLHRVAICYWPLVLAIRSLNQGMVAAELKARASCNYQE
jgi:hypothetical protein